MPSALQDIGLWQEMVADLPAASPRLARYAHDDATRCLCHAAHLDPFLRDYVLHTVIKPQALLPFP